MKEVVEVIAKSLVDYPDEVQVTETENDKAVVLELKVAQSDMGKVIGKQGRIAKAIRTVVKAAASKEDRKVIVEIMPVSYTHLKDKRRGGLFLQKQGIQFCNLTEDRMEKFFNYEIPYEDIASVRTYIPMTRLVQIQLKSGEIKIFAVNKRKIWVYEIEQKKKKGW